MNRILIFTQYFWPEDFRVNDLALELANNGYQVEVITGIPNYPLGHFFQGYTWWGPRCEYYHSIKIFRLPIIPRGNSKFTLAMNYLSFFIVSLLCLPLILFRRYDAVFTFSVSPGFAIMAGALLAKLKGVPSLVWLLDLWPESLLTAGIVRNKRILDFLRPFFIWLYDIHTVILTQSKSFSAHLEKYGIKKAKIKYFPNWAENTYSPLPARSENSEFTILYAGNLGEAQDIPNLVKSIEKLAHHQELKWIFLGDGRVKTWLIEEIEAKKLAKSVQIFSRKPQKEMPEWFSKADLLLVSLKPDPVMAMTLPGRVQSFMASAKPILAVADGETAQIVKEANCGFVVPAGDVDSLVKQIEQILPRDRSDLVCLGNNGYSYYQKNFLRQKRIESFIAILAQELKN